MYSNDPTDFSEKKYMTLMTRFFLEEAGDKIEIPEDEARRLLASMEEKDRPGQ
jgi:hypothetical protein